VCDPYENAGKPLAPHQINPLLSTLDSDWHVSDAHDELTRDVTVAEWMDASALFKTLSAVAFNENHYPKLTLERQLTKKAWVNVLRISCKTEVLGGLSFQDFHLATMIDGELERRK
jgi:pterin-4a-carbinolamine dehydratase